MAPEGAGRRRCAGGSLLQAGVAHTRLMLRAGWSGSALAPRDDGNHRIRCRRGGLGGRLGRGNALLANHFRKPLLQVRIERRRVLEPLVCNPEHVDTSVSVCGDEAVPLMSQSSARLPEISVR